MDTPEIFVISAARTAIGTFGGSLKDVPLSDLASTAVRAALERSGVAPAEIGHVAMGNVIPTEPQDAYLSRIAALKAGLPHETPCFNVSRLCGSGLQAIVSAAQSLALGDCDVALAAGAESMSRGPYLSMASRWGARLGDAVLVDYTNAVLHDPMHKVHMGMTAENVADEYGVTREMMDELAAESHRRAGRAIEEGRFKEQIVPVELKTRKGTTLFERDEHVKPETTVAVLSQMKPVFRKDGRVTAGNASGINDGAAALVLATGGAVRRLGLRPIARLVAYAHAGVDPLMMGIGPVPATRKVLARAGLAISDLDVIEANEAFAAQACAVSRALEFDPAKVNPNGSGISLGHPVGATGAIITTKAIHELHRTGKRYALATMCIGGGQGIAEVFERA